MKRGLFNKLDCETRKLILSRVISRRIPTLTKLEISNIVESIPHEYQYNIKILTSKDNFTRLQSNNPILYIYNENDNWGYCILKFESRPANKMYDLNIYKELV